MFGRLAELFLRAQCVWEALLEAGAVCGCLWCSTALAAVRDGCQDGSFVFAKSDVIQCFGHSQRVLQFGIT